MAPGEFSGGHFHALRLYGPDRFGQHRSGGVDIGAAVELAQSFLDAVGQGDFAVGIARLQ
ncbi:MAG: hypothetical protein K2Q25_14995 [Mycobacteriaceae bacterium]|nr:hypothetical protein [Mycobacteriaceae bacterium]